MVEEEDMACVGVRAIVTTETTHSGSALSPHRAAQPLPCGLSDAGWAQGRCSFRSPVAQAELLSSFWRHRREGSPGCSLAIPSWARVWRN
jgi:hypothetical protein